MQPPTERSVGRGMAAERRLLGSDAARAGFKRGGRPWARHTRTSRDRQHTPTTAVRCRPMATPSVPRSAGVSPHFDEEGMTCPATISSASTRRSTGSPVARRCAAWGSSAPRPRPARASSRPAAAVAVAPPRPPRAAPPRAARRHPGRQRRAAAASENRSPRCCRSTRAARTARAPTSSSAWCSRSRATPRSTARP